MYKRRIPIYLMVCMEYRTVYTGTGTVIPTWYSNLYVYTGIYIYKTIVKP